MENTRYLTKRRGIYYFRRRIPELSTYLAPVMLSLGTTDYRAALKSCVQATAHMDRMLDEKVHISLPEADVTAFFKAELRSYLASLKEKRFIEHMDGSLTADRVRQHRLQAFALRSLIEDGLREDMPLERLSLLQPEERSAAAKIHSRLFREFLSPSFNQGVQHRALSPNRTGQISQLEILRLRRAAVEARMAAHHALENVPLNNSEAACTMAEAMLVGMNSNAQEMPVEDICPAAPESPAMPVVKATLPQTHETRHPHGTSCISLTPGVSLITDRITAEAIYRQRDQAQDQPDGEDFGESYSPQAETLLGTDLMGTAVRLVREGEARQATRDQKLKSVSLFIYLTSVQLVTAITQRHLKTFAKSLREHLPRHYWKSPEQKRLTFKEVREAAASAPRGDIGLSPSTIERHLSTIKAVIEFAKDEGQSITFAPKISTLIPRDNRPDAERREAFSYEDAAQVFNHPLWTGSKSARRRHTPGSVILKDHHFWINLILGYTGARRAEIAGLLVSDVLEEDGIPYVYIRENHLRGLKRTHCKRRIPLHPHLLELGFLDFVANRKAGKQAILFPEAIPARSREASLDPQNPAPAFDDKFGDVLDYMWRECLNRSLGGNPKGYSLHSLRHYVNAALKEPRTSNGISRLVPDDERRCLLGHKPLDDNEGTYRPAELPLRPLYEAISRLLRFF